MRNKAKGGANCCGGNGTGCSQNSYEIASEYRKEFIKKNKINAKDAQRCRSCPENDAGFCMESKTWCCNSRRDCERNKREAKE